VGSSLNDRELEIDEVGKCSIEERRRVRERTLRLGWRRANDTDDNHGVTHDQVPESHEDCSTDCTHERSNRTLERKRVRPVECGRTPEFRPYLLS
jgi:hypothetical protein